MASIRERTSKRGETVWAVLYRHGGKQSSLTFDNPKTAADFKALVDLLGIDKALDVHRGQQPDDRLTVDELADAYLTKKARDVTPRTLTDYRRDIDNWVRPWFGHRAAAAIDEADVQKWVDHMATKLEPKSVAGRHALLSAMYAFGMARSRRLVEHSPCTETELPKWRRKPPKGVTVLEFRALLDACERRRNPDAADLILFLGETGWRFSEATALDRRDVSDDGTDVWVTVTRVTRLAGSRYVIAEDAAKTDAAFRRIRLLPESRAMVRRRILGRRPGDLVLTNRRGNPWNQHTFLDTTWPAIVREAGLVQRHPTPHWLRHFHVAVMAAAGAPMHEIQRRIGHDHYSTTVDVYGRMIGDSSDDVMGRADALLRGAAHAPSIAPVVRGEIVETLPEG